MAREMDKKDYVTLLEQAVGAAGNTTIQGGPESAGKGRGDFSKTGPEKGMNYRGVTVDGDKILNWDGKGDQFTNKKLDDIDDLVKKITKDKYGVDATKHEWTDDPGASPMSMLEMEDELDSAQEDPDAVKGEEELDVDAELSDGYQNVSFTDTESEVISKLIKEMSMLENEEDALLEDIEELEELDNAPDLDIDDIT